MNFKFTNNTRITLFLTSLSIYLLLMLTPLNIFPIKSLPKDSFLNFEYIIHFISTFILALFFFNIKTKLSDLNKINNLHLKSAKINYIGDKNVIYW